jgi:hypothetical protein
VQRGEQALQVITGFKSATIEQHGQAASEVRVGPGIKEVVI